MFALVLVPIAVGVVAYYLPRPFAIALMLLSQGFLLVQSWQLFNSARLSGPFYEGLGRDNRPLYISFRGDQTVLALALMTVLICTAALIYTLSEPFFSTRLLLLMMVLQGLSIGILVTDDIFNLFVLIEVSSLVGVLLTMYRQGLRSAYDGLYYLTVQVVAMLFFLFGIAYLYQIFGVLSVSQIATEIGSVPARALLLPMAFMITGISVKVGFFPLFSYIPRAYGNPGAPVAVLALLSSVVVSGSVYWLARFVELFSSVASLAPFLGIVGVLTVIAAAIKAFNARDILVFLAFSTASQVGLIVLGLVAGGVSREGAVFHILTHAVAKALLFLAAGVIIDRYGTGEFRALHGVARRLPICAVAIVLALASLAGLPFTAGGVSKYWLTYSTGNAWLTAAMWLSTALTVLISLRFALILFGKPADGLDATPADGGLAARGLGANKAVVATVSVGLLALGLFGAQLVPWVVGWDQSISLGSALEKGLNTLAIGAIAVPILRLMMRAPQHHNTLVVRRLAFRLTRDGALSLPDAMLVMTGYFAAVLCAGLLLGVGRQ